MWLIDANTLPRTKIVEGRQVRKNGRLTMGHVIAEVIRVEDLEKAPAVDAVPVVRCKDCKHWGRNSGIAESPNGHCFHHDIETNGYDFCSYGERRSGDE